MTLIKRLKNLVQWSVLSPAEFLALYKPAVPKEPQPTKVQPIKEMPLAHSGVAKFGPKVVPKKPKMAQIIKRHPVDPIDELLKDAPNGNTII